MEKYLKSVRKLKFIHFLKTFHSEPILLLLLGGEGAGCRVQMINTNFTLILGGQTVIFVIAQNFFNLS